MSKTIAESSAELRLRQMFADLFRKQEEKISWFLEHHYVTSDSSLHDKSFTKNIWEVAVLMVQECINKSNIEKAKNLLGIFAKYTHVYPPEIKESFEELASSISSETNSSSSEDNSEDEQHAEPKGNLMITADHTIGEDDGSPMGDNGNENPEYFF